MGFTTGLLGGFTLTSSILYLSLSLHARNRLHQSTLLQQQALLLDNIVNPQPPPPPPASREVKAGLYESAKDRWNRELEGNVRKLQTTDWSEIREQMEEGVSAVWRKAFQTSREGAEIGLEKAGEGIEKGVQRAKEEVKKGMEKAKAAAS